MKKAFIHIITLAAMFAAGITHAQDTNSAPENTSPALDSKSFDVLWKNNIFNPSRVAYRSTPPPVRHEVDWFTLSGTMSYEKGRFAFFDSNRSSYRKALKVSDTIAGYRIADIEENDVKLSASSNQVVSLPVGAQMRRVDNGRWTFNSRAEYNGESSSDSSPVTTESNPAASPASSEDSPPPSGAENDIMKRLMLKRLQEK